MSELVRLARADGTAIYPDEPDDLADKMKALGEPRAVFAVRGWRLIRNVVLAPLAIMAGLAIEGLMVFFGHGHAEAIMTGLFLLLMGIMLCVRSYRSRGLR